MVVLIMRKTTISTNPDIIVFTPITTTAVKIIPYIIIKRLPRRRQNILTYFTPPLQIKILRTLLNVTPFGVFLKISLPGTLK